MYEPESPPFLDSPPFPGPSPRRVWRHPIPEATRRAVLARCKGHCEDCGEPFTLLRRPELHHLRYWIEDPYDPPFQLSIFGRENPDDLDVLCRSCHHQRHLDLNGDFWTDPEEMFRHWQPYWEALEKDD
jgi:5-methylcytosine-specific restriction endonuclease McrA